MDIEARTRRSLEWERLKGFLSAESSSPWSRELCLSLETYTDPAVVDALLAETSEAFAMLSAGFDLSQQGLPDIREALARLKTGAQLAPNELLDIRRMLVLARRTRAQLSQLSPDEFPQLNVFAPQINAHEDLVVAIDQVFDDAGNIRDDASPLLRSLRRDIQRLNNQAREELLRIINSSNTSKALQEPIFTQRGGRYVLPVQASMRAAIQGIVHDSSASGLTVYVEPFSVVELTNKSRMKEADLEREIDRILSELSAKTRERSDSLEETNRALVEIDFIAARARLAQRYRGVKPQVSRTGELRLKQARHPLLVLQNQANASSVVANDITLGGDLRTLVITGPNTGGKTVFLKTAGLLAFMVRAGLLLPVDNGSTAVIFTRVFADIGDEQSIEQSLSTFSSHMTNIIEIINRSDSTTLALLDEVGAGTDPREGAILARVVLEHLNNSGASTISTTHYGELKSLAYTAPGFINGSFEFDESTLSPTYRLRVGVPGSSKAITIASRLGLKHELVEYANSLLSSSQSDIQGMIEQLEARLQSVDQQEQNLRDREQQIEETKASVVKLQGKLEDERERMRAKLSQQMEVEFEQARELIRTMIADLQKSPSMPKAQQLQRDFEVLRKELGWLELPQPKSTEQSFAVGQTVKVRSLNQKGTIEALPEEGKSGPDALASVRAGAMKIRVPLSDLVAIQQQGHPGKPPRSKIHSSFKSSAPHARTPNPRIASSNETLEVFVRTSRNTLDLRGQRVEEAIANLERFIDSAYLERLSPVMIIHGHGMGKVKSAVRAYLTGSPYNANFRPGENYEGGDGVTVVQFS